MLLRLLPFLSLVSISKAAECWTDRLVEVPADFRTPSCSSEDSLVEWVNEDCGQQVETYTFGKRCKSGFGGPMHADIQYTCCKPISDRKYPKLQLNDLEKRSEEAFKVLKGYLTVFKNISESKERGDDRIVEKNGLPHEFTSFLTRIREEMSAQKQRNDHENIFDTFKPNTVATRRGFRHVVKEFLYQQAMTRISITFEVILALIEEEENVLFVGEGKEKLVYDLRHTKFNYAWETAIMSPRNNLFPELEEEMQEYYINLLKHSAIGIPINELNFLGQSDSTEKLIACYEQILLEETWTNEGELNSFLLFTFWVVTAVAFFSCVRIYTLWRNRRGNDDKSDFDGTEITSDDRNLIV